MYAVRFVRIAVAAICIALAWAIPARADSLDGALDRALADFGVIKPRVSIPAPDFSLAGLDGKRLSLSSTRGKIVLLHFWATWCVPCRKEMPLLYELEKEFADQDFALMYVNVDRGNRAAVEKFLLGIGQYFHTLLDPGGEVRNTYEVRALPTSYIIGRDGKIIGKIIGERDWAGSQALDMVKALLNKDT
ncbi:MAG: TlpA disulfide reductase family protein [Mariprofundaceae bacterium]|nr:TlpA disulfide reductase family protein [Mariprofundaceae bacterium]